MGALLDELRENTIKNMDYVGFTFNGVHSSQLNILSVSDGSRYHMDLLPTIEDYSIDIVGGNGSNYFGGNFKKREFILNIAYDNVEEQHWRAMKEWLSDRETHELYFDECPYKVYNAVVSRTPNFKWIAFGDTGVRVYKGEGTIVFTCYDPIGYSKQGNYLDDYDWENIEEWSIASNMLDNQKNEHGVLYYDRSIGSDGNYVIHAYNAGEIPTPFKMYLTWTGTQLTIKNNTINKSLVLKRTATTPVTILIDTERSLAIQIYNKKEYYIDDNGQKQFTVLNQLVEDGRFFLLNCGLNELEVTGADFEEVNDFKFYHRYL